MIDKIAEEEKNKGAHKEKKKSKKKSHKSKKEKVLEDVGDN